MKYRNIRTGTVIESPSRIAGNDWEEVGASKKGNATSKPEATVTKTETAQKELSKTSSGKKIDDVTIKQIKQELDAFGIDYDKSAKKQELYDLMIEHGK